MVIKLSFITRIVVPNNIGMTKIGVRLLCTVFNQFVDTIVIYYVYGSLTEALAGGIDIIL